MIRVPAARTPELTELVDKLAAFETEDLRKDIRA